MTLSKTTTFGGRNQTKIPRIELWFALALCFVLVSGLVPIVEAGPLVISRDEQLAFARSLMKEGKYDLAVIELERFIYFLPEDPKIREARYLIALSYVLARRYESAREVLLPLMESPIRDGITEKSLFLMGESYYREGVYREAGVYYERLLSEHPQPEIENLAIYRLGWMRMHMDKWEEASHTFSLVEESSFLHGKAQELASDSLLGKDLPYKDPAAAGLLGAIVPGLGHAYVGRYRDGGVAFLLNALFIWASVEAFQSDQNVLGGILAFLELGWYSGSVYSAVNATHKYNRRLRDDFLDGLHEEIDLNRIAANSQTLGLVFRISF